MLSVDLPDIIDKFWHFFIVGGGGFTLDVSVTYLLLRGMKWHKYVSNSLGFITGVSFNYTFNRIWTFQSTDPQIGLEYMKFATIGIIGLILVNGIIYLLHTRLRLHFFWSKVAAMVVFMCWNFSANYFYTFG